MKKLWTLSNGRVGLASPELRKARLGSANPFTSEVGVAITSHLKKQLEWS